MYPSDLRDKDWALIAHHFGVGKCGNRAMHSRRSLVNGILYVVKTGCQWRMLPKDFPPWKTVYGYFRRLWKLGILEKVLADLVKIKRLKTGRNEHPSMLIIDEQSVKTAGKGQQRGFDGGGKSKDASARSPLTRREISIKCWCIGPIFTIPRGMRCSPISF